MSLIDFIVTRRFSFETASRELLRVESGIVSRVPNIRRFVENLVFSLPYVVIVSSFITAGRMSTPNRWFFLVTSYLIAIIAVAYLMFEPPTSRVCTQARLNRSIFQEIASEYFALSATWIALLLLPPLYALYPHQVAVNSALQKDIIALFGCVDLGLAGLFFLRFRKNLARRLIKLGLMSTEFHTQ